MTGAGLAHTLKACHFLLPADVLRVATVRREGPLGTAMADGMPPMTSAEHPGEESASAPNRHEAVFEAVFLKYHSRIIGILYRLLGDRSRAEELAVDVFLKLYRQPWLAGSDGNVGGWLFRTATNLGIDALRATARRGQYEDALAPARDQSDGSPDPLHTLLREEACRQVRAVLATLKPSHAQILILRADGFSYNELAESLGVKRASVGTILVRAGEKFHTRYLEMFGKEKHS